RRRTERERDRRRERGRHLHPRLPRELPTRMSEDVQKEEGFVFTVGAEALAMVRAGFELYSVLVRTLYYVVYGKRDKGATVRQMYEMGNKSVFFLSITMGFIGMIMVLQAGLQTKRVVPDFSQLGPTYLELLVRDLAASIASLMLATRVGAGIAAEIGSMVVTEQVDALRMSAADPIDYLVAPRFIASLIMTMILVIWAGTIAFVAGGATAYFAFGVNWRTFASTQLV